MRNKHMLTWIAGSSLLALAHPALAQDAADDSAESRDNREIVVTGTLVRGIAPAGTNIVGVTADDIQASSATTVSELLTDVPQFAALLAHDLTGAILKAANW